MTGVVNGVLIDPRSYFFALVGASQGDPAPDWKQKLESLHGQGMWKNPRPGQVPHKDMPFYGITVMIDAGLNARGRIWLPTAQPDALGYYTREVQVIADGPTPGSFIWNWHEIGGHAYTPINSPTDFPTQPPVETIPPTIPPTTEIPEELVGTLREALARIKAIEDNLGGLYATVTAALAELREEVAQASRRSYHGTASNRYIGSVSFTLTPKD